ncbi:MAG: hypothetical protein CVU42_13970 [Chloroflexi bacterium HGW-Chloroflexi-4]|jgi:uncharacterized protein YebE (UPF0316 family)|nr:MAG: hypothetical protein CVU42_13970 [Chloroflexi bacterium HGW-Chloroflexi-4]
MDTSLTSIPFDWYAWIGLPIIIFISRICDVTIGTIRIIFISRGLRKYAPILGFFEVLIWIVVIGQLVQNLHSPTAYIFYAAGFACGNFFGMWIEDRLAFGTSIIRVMVSENGNELARNIHDAGFGVTRVDAHGATSDVLIIYTVVKRSDANKVLSIIHNIAPNAFITVDEVRSIEKGFFPPGVDPIRNLFYGRKSK